MKKPTFMALTFFMLCEGSVLAQQLPAKVTVWAQHYGGDLVYRYQIQNVGSRPIRRFFVGLFAPDSGEGDAELVLGPRNNSATSRWLPEQSATRPFGWGVTVNYMDESEKLSLEWIEASYSHQLYPLSPPMIDNAPLPQPGDQSLQPGSTTTISAILRSADPGYTSGHVTFDTGRGLVSVPIVKGDTTPPSIQLIATRINQNEGRGEWAIFNIKVTVSDDFDPNPEVSVDPVTANQPISAGDVVWARNNSAWDVRFKNVPNRSYTFTVKATDASGNEAARSFVYEVKR